MEMMLMTEIEARSLVNEINSGISTIGGKLLELYEREGWKVLGYNSWRECCMTELDLRQSRIYQLLDFAKVERNLSTIVEKKQSELASGNNPHSEKQIEQLPQTEFLARPLTQLEQPEQQAQAWQLALDNTNGNPTAKDVEKAVKRIKKDDTVVDKTIIEVKKTHVVKNWYLIPEWEQLDQDIKNALLSKSGNSKFNTTNDNVEWARYTWNPITGCLHDCPYCYARDIANRFYTQGFEPSFLPDRLSAPQNTKRKDLEQFNNPVDKIGYRNVFTCSMADLFGKWVPQEWIEAVLKSISDNPQWTFLLLTKFPIRMSEFDYPDNVWLGTTVDYQWRVERAEKAFIKIKDSGFNGVCWLSCEPMMERLTFSSLEMFDWVVMGGSSKSTQTEEYKPPFDDIVHLHNQARLSNCKIYQKTNLIPGMDNDQRIREYPE